MTRDPYQPPSPPAPPPPADDLQFDRVEPAAPPSPASVAGFQPPPAGVPGTTACAACARPITDVYFEAGGKVVCPECSQIILASQMGGSGAAHFFKAAVFGLGAGLVGAAIWWTVRHFLNMQIGLIAILVGFMVGGAVRAGSQNRGGIGYQLLAVLLTYICIAANYVPDIIRETYASEGAADAPMWLVVGFSCVLALAVPFLRGAGGIIGLLIIGFALWEAWQLNRKQQLTFNGPFRVAGAGAGAVMGVGASAPPVGPSPAWPNYPPPPPPAGGA